MIDLACVVADKNMEAAVSALLRRHQALGIRPITRRVHVHPQKDPGCFHRPTLVLDLYRRKAKHAMIILDHAWDGVPSRTGSNLESIIQEKLRLVGMEDWAAPVVIDPELEAWVFSKSTNVARVLGWAGKTPDLRGALEQQGLWDPNDLKPRDPKAALEWALLTAKRQSITSSIFHQLADRVSVENCEDRSFMRFKQLLQDWFPPTPNTNRDGNGTRVRPRQRDGAVPKVKTRKQLIEVAIPLDAIN